MGDSVNPMLEHVALGMRHRWKREDVEFFESEDVEFFERSLPTPLPPTQIYRYVCQHCGIRKISAADPQKIESGEIVIPAPSCSEFLLKSIMER